jgi:hypothetical protein
MATTSTSGSTYRYDHFRLSHMMADVRFDPDTPTTGDRLPQLDLDTLDGERITFGDLDRPHLFVFGSNTCPMTASAGGVLAELHREFGDDIRFVLVQVREAHPGEHIPQPSSVEEKRAHARRLRDTLGVNFAVAVDDLDGSFHSSLDPKPNAAYLVDTQARILFRSMWSSDEQGLRTALTATIEGRTPDKRQSTRVLKPTIGALGHVGPVIDAAGPRARRDLLRSAPPMLLGARLAGLFRGVSPNRRGHALLAAVGAAVLAVVAVALLL